MKYEPVIGLEVHVELKTNSKMFCGCSADYFGKEPNTYTCPVCLGLPGALPIPNKKAIEWCVAIGLALNCEIPLFSKFDRKNYFYPDLAKGYQISQYDEPFCVNGWIELKGSTVNDERITNNKRIRIRRVHMEEDTAKLIHQIGVQSSKFKVQNDKEYSLIDFNRSGVPLVEIVTEPDFESADEVVEYLKKLQQIVRYLGVSNANMEKGEMRLEPNISLYTHTSGEPFGYPRGGRMDSSGVGLPPYKVEVKNINSFRFVDKAIKYEIKRQSEILDRGETPVQETRGFVEISSSTKSQRVKEEAHDYRYFPEPDIPPIRWERSQISNFKSQMPELPDQKLERFKTEYELNDYDAEILTREKTLADYFEEAVKVGKEHNISPKQIANQIINRKTNIEQILPAKLVQQITLTSQTSQISQAELEKVIKEMLSENQKAVLDYKNGKENVIMYLVGRVMKKLEKKVDAEIVKNVIKTNIAY